MPVSLAHSGQCCAAACLWSGCDCIEPVVTLSPRLVPPVAGRGLDPGPTPRFHGTERVRACHLVQRCCQDQRGQGRDLGPSNDPGQVPLGLRPGLGVGVRRACPSGQEAAPGASPQAGCPHGSLLRQWRMNKSQAALALRSIPLSLVSRVMNSHQHSGASSSACEYPVPSSSVNLPTWTRLPGGGEWLLGC